jgi:FAD:protein FMN transferase
MVLTETSSYASVRERVWQSSQRTVSGSLHTLQFRAMSTHCQVKAHGTPDPVLKTYFDNALDWVAWFEARYSRFIDDSLISRINQAAGREWVEIDPETEVLFNLCQEMIFFTSGVFDPTSLPLIKLWNWKAQPPTVPSHEAIAKAQKLVGWSSVRRRKGAVMLPVQGMMIDLGGIGKEYAVDRVVQMGLDVGLTNVLVDFGQDVRVHGRAANNTTWRIGLENPHKPGSCWAALSVSNAAVATSGDYVRHFVHDGRRYGHIIDPRTGYPSDNGTMSVSIIAPHCTFAGILSTAAFILGPQDGLKMMRVCPGVEGVITTENDNHATRGFMNYATKLTQ